MRICYTTPLGDPREAAGLFAGIEAAGYDTAFSFESSHDPFIPLALAAGATSSIRLGTAVAIGFARNPMILANIGYDLQLLTEGRFVLGLGSQIRPHIENRFSERWGRPAARMREMVRAIRAIWDAWQTGGELAFEGEFYRHTLMTPAFDPGPNPFGTAPILVGGFGPAMVGVAGEVADGLVVHPFNSRRSVEETTLPALDAGLARAGRRREEVEVIWVTNVVTWDDDAEREHALLMARAQLAFYGSTPAYRPPMELHGWADLQPALRALSKRGAWEEMAALVPDEMLETLAVVGPRDEIADRIVDRVAGLERVDLALVNNRNPDPAYFADVVAALRARI
jgi:probable F420-dependent oxidoreductase